MTREEAMKVIREMREWLLNDREKEALETLVPELRESEDEKVMKELITHLRQEVNGATLAKNRVMWEKMLAWVEKQKESNHIPWYDLQKSKEAGYTILKTEEYEELMKQKEQKPIEDVVKDITKNKESAIKFLKSAGIMDDNGELAEMYRSEQKPADYDHEMWKNCEANFEGGKKEVIDHPEKYGLQKEQNPTMIQWTGKNLKEVIDFTGKSQKFGEWFKSWEEYEKYVHSHGNILKLFKEDGSHYEVPVGAWIIKTPDGYNIPSRFKLIQKPVEWSEEDEKMLKRAIGLAKNRAHGPIDEMSDRSYYIELLDWLVNRFKLLRPQPHWKPSKEQMEALETAERWYSDNMGCNLALVSLCEQLKKLM